MVAVKMQPENTQLDLVGAIAALEESEPHVSSVFELLDTEVDLQFLRPVGSLPQLSGDETVCQPSAQGLSPDAFAWDSIELAALQFAEPAIAADNRFNSNKIDQVVTRISKNGITQSDQPTRLRASKPGRRNRPKEPTMDAPHCLISAHPRANPIRS
jgi:hypothetical protein